MLLLLCLTAEAASLGAARRAVVRSPEDAEAWNDLGDAYRRRLKRRRAREAYARALSLDPGNTDAAAGLGRVSGRRNPSAVRKALRNPTDDELWGDAGDYYLSTGQSEEALSAYRYALQLDPTDTEWQQSVMALGGVDEVMALLQDQLEGANDEVLGDMGDMLRSVQREEEACEMYRRALAMDPTDTEWGPRVSECDGGISAPLGGLGMPEGSLDGLSIASLSAQVYSNPELLTRLGIAHARAGDKESAQRYLHSALLLAPTEESALESYGAVTQRTRLEILEQLSEEVPDNDEVLGELGDALLALGRVQEAAAHYALALKLDADDPEWSEKLSLLAALQ